MTTAPNNEPRELSLTGEIGEIGEISPHRAKRRIGIIPLLLTLLTLAIAPQSAHAWGSEGHAFVADVAIRSLPLGPLRGLYTGNEVWFETDSSFPDRWRYRDNTEAPRHFLHGESFGKDQRIDRLPADYASLLKIRNYDQLRTDGVLPWAAACRYRLLVLAFREKRWDDAMVESVYLSNYISDAYDPFHATGNGDPGIRSRFGTQTLRRGIAAADLKPGDPILTPNPTTATLNALEESSREVAPILQMDRAASAAEGDTNYGDAYWKAFLPLARPVAIAHLEQGGRLLAGVLLTAWNEAGQPPPPVSFVMTDRLLPYAPELPSRDQPIGYDYPTLDDDQLDAGRSRAQTFNIASRHLKKTVTSTIFLPQGYDPRGAIHYPVLYLLHGSSGSHTDWNDQTGIGAYTSGLPLIVVLADGAGDTWYVNSPRGGAWEDYFVHELIPYVDRTYRTIPRREGRAIGGNSMGGYGAWHIALAHPRLFVATASLSGALDFGSGDLSASGEEPDYGRALFGDASSAIARRAFAGCQILPEITREIRNGAYTGPALYFNDGRSDYLNTPNRQMEQSLLTLGVPYEYAEFEGGHNWTYWDAHARDMLNFVLRHLSPPRAAPPGIRNPFRRIVSL